MAVYTVTEEPIADAARSSSDDRSLGELIGDLTRETTDLVRNEIDLAKRELTAKATRVGKDIGMIVAGGTVALGGMLTLVAFLVLALAALGLALWASALIVGLVLTGAGAGVAMAALKQLRQVDPVPHQTMEALSSPTEARR